MVRVFYSESDWLHCPKCGEETVEIVKPNGYDASTGRSRTKHYRKCPNGRWWNSGAPSFMGDNADPASRQGRDHLHRPAPFPDWISGAGV